MNRLTFKVEQTPIYDCDYKANVEQKCLLDKLGQLEDIEEELGTDLITLCKILKHNECYDKENKDCHIVGVTIDKVILMPKSFPYGECEFTRPFTELNKTWFLTRKELEK